MYIKKEIDSFWELERMVWSGAIDTLKTIAENDKEDELMELLDEEFWEGNDPTDTELNDFLWFEDEYIFERLGIGELEEEEEEE